MDVRNQRERVFAGLEGCDYSSSTLTSYIMNSAYTRHWKSYVADRTAGTFGNLLDIIDEHWGAIRNAFFSSAMLIDVIRSS